MEICRNFLEVTVPMESFVSRKLDFLMKLADVQNSTLGKAVSFDASYISRIRKGGRNLPTHKTFIEPAAAFFARRLTEDYQKDVMARLAGCEGAWPESPEEAAAFIAAWLRSPPEAKAMPRRAPKAELPRASDAKSPVRFFYGNEGKRQAVKEFLSDLFRLPSMPVLLLASDEDMSWMYEKSSFAREWGGLLSEYLRRGGRIKIIHTIRRDIGEMMEAVKKWAPIYATGTVEPYHCTRLRDIICPFSSRPVIPPSWQIP